MSWDWNYLIIRTPPLYGKVDTPKSRRGTMLWLIFIPTGLLLVLYLASFRKQYSIKGKHVLITGGSSGIGKSLAHDAIKRGAAAVTLVARNKERLERAKADIEKELTSSQKVHILAADVSSVDIKETLRDAVATNGHVDVLVNCAGNTHTATLLDTPSQKYEELFNLNVLGSVYTTQMLLPAMMEKKSGRVVFISSQAGQLGVYGYTAYSTTKYALRGLAETLQMEVAPYKIGVSISFPPDTNTPQLREETTQRDAIQTELATFGTVFEPEQISREVWSGVEYGSFQITHGLDGFMLGNLTAGMGPAHTSWDAAKQVLLSGVFRLVSLVYLAMFYRVVRKGIDNGKKTQ